MVWRCLVFLVAMGGLGLGQNAHPVTNRQIAAVSTDAGQDWLSRPQRDTEECPDMALDVIGIQPGASVADVGAGSGYFTWRLGERVGEAGKVYAVDIQAVMLDRIRNTIKAHGLGNVKIVKGTDQDPHLPAGKLDVVLLANVYDEFTHPQEMLRRIREALKPEGKLVVIEYRKEDASLPLPPQRKMSIAEIRTEMEPEGFHFEKILGVLPHQHLLIFSRR